MFTNSEDLRQMSLRIVRQSKFRHVFGQPLKREQCYDNIRITKNSWDSNFCAVNPKFLAIITEIAGGGAFLVLPLQKTGRIDISYPQVAGHKGPVMDIAWCPHNDNVIASSSDDTLVRVWQIPEGGLVRPLVDPVVELAGHQKKVGLVQWHPSANNVLLSAGADCKIMIWNVGTGELLSEVIHPDLIFDCCWSWNGSRLATTCKDKKIRVYDPRSGEMLQEALGHEGAKPQRVVYLRSGMILTTGFSRMSERQYSLRKENDLNSPLCLEEMDVSNGVMVPFYDPDVNLLFLCAKGDSNIRYFEITEVSPFVHYINTYQSNIPQRGMCMMPKRGCDISRCEIAKFIRLHSNGFCEVLSFTVPRKSEQFQDDLYPLTAADVPAISAEEWAEGKDADPVLVSLKEGYVPSQKQELKVTKKTNVLDKLSSKKAEPSPEQALPKPDKKIEELMEEIKNLKCTVSDHEQRIKELENKIEATCNAFSKHTQVLNNHGEGDHLADEV
ncbi:coronin-6-like isoform X2 [Tachypleus tridentatus]|uniref:coronin-6-like isoform X2 n=1 Tax=Tachypleus tridentatus TaxID=6853 RepID=UPI003FD18DE1